MNLTEIQSLVGSLCNDAGHDRYSLSDINTELDNSQDSWNISAKIISDTVTLTTVDGTRQYALSSLTGTPISFPRVTHKGIDLEKRSKSYFDLYSGEDWTATTGTPTAFYIEAQDADNQYLTVRPVPGGNDAGANLVVEYIKRHTPMSASTDTPFMSVTTENYLLRPYDWGLAYDAASRLLVRDPTQENVVKVANFAKIASNVMANVIQVFKSLEQEEPHRIRGGRNWRGGNLVGRRK